MDQHVCRNMGISFATGEQRDQPHAGKQRNLTALDWTNSFAYLSLCKAAGPVANNFLGDVSHDLGVGKGVGNYFEIAPRAAALGTSTFLFAR